MAPHFIIVFAPLISLFTPAADVAPKKELSMASAPYGSALILPISWMYIHMLGTSGALHQSKKL